MYVACGYILWFQFIYMEQKSFNFTRTADNTDPTNKQDIANHTLLLNCCNLSH